MKKENYTYNLNLPKLLEKKIKLICLKKDMTIKLFIEKLIKEAILKELIND